MLHMWMLRIITEQETWKNVLFCFFLQQVVTVVINEDMADDRLRDSLLVHEEDEMRVRFINGWWWFG